MNKIPSLFHVLFSVVKKEPKKLARINQGLPCNAILPAFVHPSALNNYGLHISVISKYLLDPVAVCREI